jgi:hypothetical protein
MWKESCGALQQLQLALHRWHGVFVESGLWLFYRIRLQKGRKDFVRKTIIILDRVVFLALSMGIDFLYGLSRLYLARGDAQVIVLFF